MTNITYLLKNVTLVNEGAVLNRDVLIKDGRIEKIESEISNLPYKVREINSERLTLMPGVIDDHVHFREPGLTHKGDIASESRAAVAGGVTSYMEMPNTIPQTTNLDRLDEKLALANEHSMANYAFYLGATQDNLETIKAANEADICGIKVFMGSSTGNMLVDDDAILEDIFTNTRHLVAVHAEHEPTIAKNLEAAKNKYGEDLPISAHPEIRNEEACYLSSQQAIALARKHQTRLHILHLTTEAEIGLFDSALSPDQKLITTEACVHHLYFSSEDYEKWGNWLKCFPAIKGPRHKKALLNGLLSGAIDNIASDHAPHTLSEKKGPYSEAPGGIPMVQHTLPVMLEFYQQGLIALPQIVEKMCHNPALTHGVSNRGFLREGYQADCVLVNTNRSWTVGTDNTFYKCHWTPFMQQTFSSAVTHTFVNGVLAYHAGAFTHQVPGEQLHFAK